MVWRVARAVLTLRDQINAAYPKRSKASDGTIGDTAHIAQGNASDHNPWLINNGVGVVSALDITHDPVHGCDIDKISDQLQASRDRRIKYVIANGLIMNGHKGSSPWVWRTYNGSDKHTNHMHVSVETWPSLYDDATTWNLGLATAESVKVRDLQQGMEGDDVKALQRKLGVTADGDFGPKTKAAVVKFQKANKLTADGIVGPKTRAALGL